MVSIPNKTIAKWKLMQCVLNGGWHVYTDGWEPHSWRKWLCVVCMRHHSSGTVTPVCTQLMDLRSESVLIFPSRVAHPLPLAGGSLWEEKDLGLNLGPQGDSLRWSAPTDKSLPLLGCQGEVFCSAWDLGPLSLPLPPLPSLLSSFPYSPSLPSCLSFTIVSQVGFLTSQTLGLFTQGKHHKYSSLKLGDPPARQGWGAGRFKMWYNRNLTCRKTFIF